MSNVETKPEPVVCEEGTARRTEVVSPRDVPLGGLRAMNVRRTLPSRQRSLIGAWCFIDHYGPDQIESTGGMNVAPHPHIGLQTVSWLFQGEIEHRDSAGNHAMVLPGEVNLMTAGRGISHSEISTEKVSVLHGVQLWVALPEEARGVDPGFAHYTPEPVHGDGFEARVFLGSLLGETSPVETFTPLLGSEFVLHPGASVVLEVDNNFEHGLLLDAGALTIEPLGLDLFSIEKDQLGYVPTGVSRLVLSTTEGARLMLLGGPPFGEQVIMWWNFLARTQEEIVAARSEWQRQITDSRGGVLPDSQQVAEGQFGVVVGDHLPPIPAPALPETVRLRPRS